MFEFLWKLVFCSCLLRCTLSEVNGKLEGKCSENWTYSGGSCYFIINRADTWSKGKEKCEKKSSSLAKISSSAEHKFLSRMLYTSTHKKGNFDYTWIGLKRCGTDDPKKFCWTDESEAGFIAWKKDQPSNRPSQPNQRCVAQQMNTGLWNNKECHHDKYMALCERVLPSVQHSITNISSESAVVHWKSTGPSSDISYYRVLLRADAGPLVFQLNSTSVKLEQLRHGTYYEVQVQAVTPAGSGAPSNTTVFRTVGNGSKPKIKQLTAMKPIQDSDGTKNEYISLFCEAVGVLPLTFSWTRDGEEIEKQSRIRQTAVQLRIRRTRNERGAKYECVVENKRGLTRKSITLSDSLWAVGQSDDENEENLAQDLLAFHLAIACGMLMCLVVILATLVVLMCRRVRNAKNASSVSQDTTLEPMSPTSSPARTVESELNSFSEDGSQELAHNDDLVPIYQSPILKDQSPSRSPSEDRKGELKYHYAYDHTAGAKARLSSITSHTYINDSQASLEKPKPRETGSERFRPVSDFVNGQRHYVNTTKSLPDRSSVSENVSRAFGRNQNSVHSSLMCSNLFSGKRHYVNNSEITNQPLVNGERSYEHMVNPRSTSNTSKG